MTKRAELPCLPFPDNSFSLVLSSHFLFLYGDRLGPEFHMSCLREIVRVSSGEMRIYPLTGLDTQPYPYLDDVVSILHSEGINTEICEVPFEFQRGANMMMRLQCS